MWVTVSFNARFKPHRGLVFVSLVGDQTQISANSYSAKWPKPPRMISSSTNYRSFFSSLCHISDNNVVLCSRCNFILGSVLKKIMLLLNFYFATSYSHWFSHKFPICFRIVGHCAFIFHWSVYGYLLFCWWLEPDWHRLSGVDISWWNAKDALSRLRIVVKDDGACFELLFCHERQSLIWL